MSCVVLSSFLLTWELHHYEGLFVTKRNTLTLLRCFFLWKVYVWSYSSLVSSNSTIIIGCNVFLFYAIIHSRRKIGGIRVVLLLTDVCIFYIWLVALNSAIFSYQLTYHLQVIISHLGLSFVQFWQLYIEYRYLLF